MLGLANIKLIIAGIILTGVFGAGWWVESQIAGTTLRNALEAQETALHTQCDADKKLTSEVSNALQKKLSATNARLSELKRVYSQTTCLPIARAAGGPDAATGAKLTGPDGITVTALFDYAGDAEKYRLQLESCQQFISKVWSRP